MKKIFAFFFIFSILFAACSSAATATPTASKKSPVKKTPASETSTMQITDIPLGAGYGARGAWFQLYFTNPQSPLASQKTGGPDAPLAEAIDAAQLSVDVAVYSFSLNSIRDALIRAYKRGVVVRMVMESDNMGRSDPQKLIGAGIPVVGDHKPGLMHDKFVVIDNSEVWMGSMNFTDSGGYADNNSLMRIRSVKMAENYAKEFEEMYTDKKFGDAIVAETPNPRVIIDGTPIDVYFSPDDKVQASLLELLDTAQESVYFLAFSFTADEIGDVLRNHAKEGATISGVMEDEQINSNIGTEFDPFKQYRMDVLRDGNDGQMHHKTMIIDESIVVVGSYNFTNSAETRNDENLLVIYNKEIAAQFVAEFQRVYAQAK